MIYLLPTISCATRKIRTRTPCITSLLHEPLRYALTCTQQKGFKYLKDPSKSISSYAMCFQCVVAVNSYNYNHTMALLQMARYRLEFRTNNCPIGQNFKVYFYTLTMYILKLYGIYWKRSNILGKSECYTNCTQFKKHDHRPI